MLVAPESTTRARTRLAILEAAVRLLARNPAASLTQIASEAGVGRTTVHRYFADRAELLHGVDAEFLNRIDQVAASAQSDDGPAIEAILRLCQGYFELGDWLTVLFTGIIDDPWDKESRDSDRILTAAITRGQGDGSIDPTQSVTWHQSVMWATLYTAWEHGRTSASARHEALTYCLQTMRKVLAPPPR